MSVNDPLPGPAVTTATWSSIRTTKRLIHLGSGHVLDWEPSTGGYRIWQYDRSVTSGDPLPGAALAKGTWSSVQAGHEIIYLGNDRVLVWHRANQTYRIWKYARGASGDPLPDPTQVAGSWGYIGADHELISIGKDRLLDWHPATGDYRVWRYDSSVSDPSDPLPGSAVVSGNWSTIRAGHRLIYLGDDELLDWEPSTGRYRVFSIDHSATGAGGLLESRPRTRGIWAGVRTGHELVYLGRDRVMDWVPATGDVTIWKVSRSAGFQEELRLHFRVLRSPTVTIDTALQEMRDAYDTQGVWVNEVSRRRINPVDPLPGPAVTSGTWTGLRTGHRLLFLDNGRVLDWERHNGDYRIWPLDRSATGSADPLPGPATVSGNWTSVRTGHELVYVGKDRVLDWQPASKEYKVWRYDRSVTSGDPLPGPAVTSGTWSTIGHGHELIWLGDDRILDFERATGEWRLFRFQYGASGSTDPLPSAYMSGQWSTIRTGHKLVPLDTNRMLDWEPSTGAYRVWTMEPAATSGDVLQGPPEAEGTWASIRTGHTLIGLGGNRVLDWQPHNGKFVIWRYDRNAVSPHLDVSVGACMMGSTTAEQRRLFGFRRGIASDDVVVYYVRSTIPPLNGCASHPAGVPAAVVVRSASRWTMAHEVGHVLGLSHVGNNNQLMTGNGTFNITNPPADLVDSEGTTMRSSSFVDSV